ncbi:CPBP family intramembrane glutamic endopeptidase [Erythrobacter sp. JK5]|uniref:CPBP family intramembrane glutamic endopeptidase n=1 Tax=Erythrobacter sp. JK5 TaxID=2829500 RepID=UPI0020137EAA|nr:CPBP family intramembrane glutamic endopeptidase [Erythrobacter sp. JK5]
MSDDDHEETLSVVQVLTLMALQTALLGAFGWALWWFSGRELGDFVGIDVYQVTIGLAIGAALIVVIGGFFYGFPRIAEQLVRAQGENLKFLENRLSLGAIVLISIGAGVGEEALFRGGLQTLAGDYMAMPLAIAASSVLFALVHLARPLISVLIFVIGCVFGVLYWQTGSLLAVMIGHAVYDVFALWYVQRELHRIGYFTENAERMDEVAASE